MPIWPDRNPAEGEAGNENVVYTNGLGEEDCDAEDITTGMTDLDGGHIVVHKKQPIDDRANR